MRFGRCLGSADRRQPRAAVVAEHRLKVVGLKTASAARAQRGVAGERIGGLGFDVLLADILHGGVRRCRQFLFRRRFLRRLFLRRLFRCILDVYLGGVIVRQAPAAEVAENRAVDDFLAAERTEDQALFLQLFQTALLRLIGFDRQLGVANGCKHIGVCLRRVVAVVRIKALAQLTVGVPDDLLLFLYKAFIICHDIFLPETRFLYILRQLYYSIKRFRCQRFFAVANCQLSAVSRQRSVGSRQSSAVSRQLSVGATIGRPG